MRLDFLSLRRGNPRVLPKIPPKRAKLFSKWTQTNDNGYDDHIERTAYSMEALESTSHLPRAVYCPISRMPMQDPVVATDGHSYERKDIQRWLQKKQVSPLTGVQIATFLVPNHALRNVIADLMADS